MKKLGLNSILSRLFISFLVVITPIMAAGIMMFMWEKQTIQSQIENSALDNVSFLQSNLETEIGNIKLLQYNLASDVTLNELVRQYASLQKYDYYTSIRDVRQRLKVIKSSNNYIQNVIVYILGMKCEILADGYLDFDENEYNRMFSVEQNAKYPLIMDSSGLIVTTIYPLNSGASETPMYLAEIVLSREKIQQFLNKFSAYSINNTALYDYTSGNWIFSSQSELDNTGDAKLSGIASSSKNSLNTISNIEGKSYYVISVYSKFLNMSFVQYVPVEDIFRVPDMYGNFLWIYAVLSVLIMLAYSWFTYKFVKYPVNTILKAFKRLEEGDLNTRVQLKAATEFNDLFDGFNKMVFRLNELINKVYRQELYAKKSELKQLQSQINPHFLFNTYYMLHRLIKYREMENAELLSNYLGTYLEYITRNASDEVPLQNELDHARSYAQIQQMRFSRRLSVEFSEIPENFRECLVPRMILQPILENSFEHGLKSAEKNGLLQLTFEEIGAGLFIVIEDSGDVLKDEDIKTLRQKLDVTDNSIETTGIINVHRRIVLRYGHGSGITVLRSELGGLRVEMRIFLENSKSIGLNP